MSRDTQPWLGAREEVHAHHHHLLHDDATETDEPRDVSMGGVSRGASTSVDRATISGTQRGGCRALQHLAALFPDSASYDLWDFTSPLVMPNETGTLALTERHTNVYRRDAEPSLDSNAALSATEDGAPPSEYPALFTQRMQSMHAVMALTESVPSSAMDGVVGASMPRESSVSESGGAGLQPDVLLGSEAVFSDPASQACFWCLSSITMMAQSIATDAAFAAILAPLTALLDAAALSAESRSDKPSVLSHPGLYRLLQNFLRTCLDLQDPTLPLSILLRIGFAKGCGSEVVGTALQLLREHTQLKPFDARNVVAPLFRSLEEVVLNTAFLEVGSDIAKERTTLQVQHTGGVLVEGTEVRREWLLCANTVEGISALPTTTLQAHAICGTSVLHLAADAGHPLATTGLPTGAHLRSIAHTEVGTFFAATVDTEWVLLSGVFTDDSVAFTQLHWPEGMERCGPDGWLKLVAGEGGLVCVVGQRVAVDGDEGEQALRVVREHIAEFDNVTDMLHSSEVPFEMVVEDVTRQLEEAVSAERVRELAPQLPAALRAAARAQGQATRSQPSLTLYALSPLEGMKVLHTTPLGSRAELSEKNFLFNGAMRAEASSILRARGTGISASLPVTFESWIRFRAVSPCTLFLAGTNATHFHVSIGLQNFGAYVTGGWWGLGRGGETASGRLQTRLADTWIHVAVVFDPSVIHGEQVKIYIQGERAEPHVPSDLADDGGAPLHHSLLHSSSHLRQNMDHIASTAPRIPGSNVLLGHEFQGTMREARVWSHARSAAELLSGMRHTLQVHPTNQYTHQHILAHWQLAEGTGMQLFDSGPHSLHLRPTRSSPIGKWEKLDGQAPPLRYTPSAGAHVHPPLALAFQQASLYCSEGRICILQPLGCRHVTSEYSTGTGLLVSEKTIRISEGPLAWCPRRAVRWHVCNRMAKVTVTPSPRLALCKAVLMTSKARDGAATQSTDELAWTMVRVLALLECSGHEMNRTSEDCSAYLADTFGLLTMAERALDAYAALLLLVVVAKELSSPELRLPRRRLTLSEDLQENLLPALVRVRERFGDDTTLPIAALVKDAIYCCIWIVYPTPEQRSAALVNRVFSGEPLVPELSLHCHTPKGAALAVSHLLSSSEDRGLQEYTRILLSCAVKHSCEMMKAASSMVQKTKESGDILKHIVALQVALAARTRDSRETDFFAAWIHPVLQAANDIIQCALQCLASKESAACVVEELHSGLLGVVVPQLIAVVPLLKVGPFETGNELSTLRSAVRVLKGKLTALLPCEAFHSGVATVPSIVSQTHESAHPYRLDAVSFVRFEGAESFTITFDAQSRLEGRDELVILYVCPTDRKTKMKTIKDNIAQAKLTINASAAIVFPRGSLRNSQVFPLSSSRSGQPGDMQRSKWGYSFTAKASAECLKYRLGWLHDLLIGLAYASAASAQAMLETACPMSIPLEKYCVQGSILVGGVTSRVEKKAKRELDDDCDSGSATEVASDMGVNPCHLVPEDAWASLLAMQGQATTKGPVEVLMRIVVSAAVHLYGVVPEDAGRLVTQPEQYSPHSIALVRERLQGLPDSSRRNVAKRSAFLIYAVQPICRHEGVPPPLLQDVTLEVTDFVVDESPVGDLRNVKETLLGHKERARRRARGLGVLAEIQREGEQWVREGNSEGDAFVMQAVAEALSGGFRNQSYERGIECSGEVLVSVVRTEVWTIVENLLKLAQNGQDTPAASALQRIALSSLSLAWPIRDSASLASSPLAINLLKSSALIRQENGRQPACLSLSGMPHGQHLSSALAKAEDPLGWHVSVEGAAAHVRHDGRSLTHHFLWNSDARKGKNIVHAAKAWNLRSISEESIFYFEVTFTECAHRLTKGLSIGLCCPTSPFSHQTLYKSNGNVCSTSPVTTVLPRFRLGDTVGCGVASVAGAPHVFFTRNGEFFGFIREVPPQLRIAVPATGAKYGSKVKYSFSPEDWVFDASTVHGSHVALSGCEQRHKLARAQSAHQAWKILRAWTVRSAVTAEALPLFKECVETACAHAQECLHNLDESDSAEDETWVQRHVVMLYCALEAAEAEGEVHLARCVQCIVDAKWGPVLHTILQRAVHRIDTCTKAAETVTEILRLVLNRHGPDHALLGKVADTAPIKLFKLDETCLSAGLSAGHTQPVINAFVGSIPDEPAAAPFAETGEEHALVSILLRGASEITPFLAKPSAARKAFAMICIRLLRVLAAQAQWEHYIEASLCGALERCPVSREQLCTDMKSGGQAFIGAFTALAVLGAASPPLARGVKAILRPAYGLPQKCTIAHVAEGGTVTVILEEDATRTEKDASRERVSPLDQPETLLCAKASAKAVDVCTHLVTSIAQYSAEGLTGQSFDVAGLTTADAECSVFNIVPEPKDSNTVCVQTVAPAALDMQYLNDDPERFLFTPPACGDTASSDDDGDKDNVQSDAKTAEELAPQCRECVLPIACALSALIHASLAATSSVVGLLKTSDPHVCDVASLEACAHSLSQLTAKGVMVPAMISQLLQRKEACLGMLEDGLWQTVPTEDSEPLPEGPPLRRTSDFFGASIHSSIRVQTIPGGFDEENMGLQVVGTNPSVQRQRQGSQSQSQSPNYQSTNMRASALLMTEFDFPFTLGDEGTPSVPQTGNAFEHETAAAPAINLAPVSSSSSASSNANQAARGLFTQGQWCASPTMAHSQSGLATSAYQPEPQQSLPAYQHELSNDELAEQNEDTTAQDSDAKFAPSGPLHVVWKWSLLWHESLCVAEARCLSVTLGAFLHAEGSMSETSDPKCDILELLSMLDAPALVDPGDVQDAMRENVSRIVSHQATMQAQGLALDAVTRVNREVLIEMTQPILETSGAAALGQSYLPLTQETQYTTPSFDLVLKLLEVLVRTCPQALLINDRVMHALIHAVHLHAVHTQRKRIMRCITTLIGEALKQNTPVQEIACHWEAFGAIRYHCEKNMSLLTAAQVRPLLRGANGIPVVAAEMLYVARKLLRRKGIDFDDIVVADDSGDSNADWKVGKLVERQDSNSGRWLLGVVLAVSQHRVHVTLKGLPSVQDQWVSKASDQMRQYVPRVSAPITASAFGRTVGQEFGSNNDVSNVLQGSVQHPAEPMRNVPLIVASVQDEVCLVHHITLHFQAPGIPKKIPTPQLPVSACDDLRTMLTSCGSSDVPRWYECTSASGAMYTIVCRSLSLSPTPSPQFLQIVDLMIAVDMNTGAVSPVVTVGELVEPRKIPFGVCNTTPRHHHHHPPHSCTKLWNISQNAYPQERTSRVYGLRGQMRKTRLKGWHGLHSVV